MSEPICPWSGLTPGTVSFCEERLCAWVAEPANTWSALGYVFIGAYLFFTHARRSGDARLQMACVAEVLIGLGSMAFHGTGSFIGEFIDLVGMFLLSGLVVAYAAGKARGLAPTRTAQLYAGIVVASAVLMLIVRPIGIPLFSAQVTIGIGWELFMWRRATGEERRNYRLLFQGLGLFAVSFAIWVLDITRTVCDPRLHFISGHAVWHVLNALVVERMYRFYASQPLRPSGQRP